VIFRVTSNNEEGNAKKTSVISRLYLFTSLVDVCTFHTPRSVLVQFCVAFQYDRPLLYCRLNNKICYFNIGCWGNFSGLLISYQILETTRIQPCCLHPHRHSFLNHRRGALRDQDLLSFCVLLWMNRRLCPFQHCHYLTTKSRYNFYISQSWRIFFSHCVAIFVLGRVWCATDGSAATGIWRGVISNAVMSSSPPPSSS